MLKIIVQSGKYFLIREIDKVIEDLGEYKTMKEAQAAKEEVEGE